ncbi:MAG TPA: hypothetical protein DCZ74_09320 [Treponema sp.]|nr:hypothetical protein [Treponema sp.]
MFLPDCFFFVDDAGWNSHEVKIVVNEKMPGDFLTDVSDGFFRVFLIDFIPFLLIFRVGVCLQIKFNLLFII